MVDCIMCSACVASAKPEGKRKRNTSCVFDFKQTKDLLYME